MRFGTKISGDEDWGARMEPRFGDKRDFFQWLGKAGFGFVEFSCGDEPRREILTDYARCCVDAGIGVSLHPYTTAGSPVGFGVGPVEEVNHGLLELAGELAQIAGQPQRMVLHAGLARTGPYAPEYEQGMERAGAFFRWLDEQVSERYPNVRPFCETAMPAEERDDFERLADTWQTVLELVDGTDLEVCWDTGHAYLSALYGKHDEMPPERFLERVGHVHLHDVRREGEDAYSDHHPPGQGMSPWRHYARRLAETGYDDWILIELSAHLFRDRQGLRDALACGMQELSDVFGRCVIR